MSASQWLRTCGCNQQFKLMTLMSRESRCPACLAKHYDAERMRVMVARQDEVAPRVKPTAKGVAGDLTATGAAKAAEPTPHPDVRRVAWRVGDSVKTLAEARDAMSQGWWLHLYPGLSFSEAALAAGRFQPVRPEQS